MIINFKVPNVQISKLSAGIAGICFGLWLLVFEVFHEGGGLKAEISKFQRSKYQICLPRLRVIFLAFGYWPLKFSAEGEL